MLRPRRRPTRERRLQRQEGPVKNVQSKERKAARKSLDASDEKQCSRRELDAIVARALDKAEVKTGFQRGTGSR